MSERPILFSAPMVLALLAGTKTQTRRIVKPQPVWHPGWASAGRKKAGAWIYGSPTKEGDQWGVEFDEDHRRRACTAEAYGWGARAGCPYGVAGDRLWVRETWAPAPPIAPLLQHNGAAPRPEVKALYRANPHQAQLGVTWKPSIHMPRWVSRISLEVTGVRVERLQDISGIDAIAEGVERHEAMKPFGWFKNYLRSDWACASAIESYSTLWESISGAGSWAENPWVWVVEFTRLP